MVRHALGWGLLSAGVLFLLPGLLLSLARLITPGTTLGFALVAFTPWGIAFYLLALVCFLALLLLGLRGTGALLGLVAAAGLALHLVWLAPDFAGHANRGPANLTVMQLNMHFGEADPAAVVRLARSSGADVVALEETTPGAIRAVQRHGLDRTLGHRTDQSGPGEGYGVDVFSRYPISDVVRLGVSSGGYALRVQAPRPFWLLAVHFGQALDDLATWRHDLLLTSRAAARLHGPRVVVGDLNATLDQPTLDRLLDTGLADAARQSGAGWQPTWPGAQGPPVLRRIGLLRIDHVLVGGGVRAVSTATAEVPDTDHRALVARLRLPGMGD